MLKRFIVDTSQIRSLEIDDLNVKRLRVGELVVTDKLVTPAHDAGKI